MSISTKTGDKGKTALLAGGRVSKDDLHIEICGCLDELSSFLGMAKSLIKEKKTISFIESIQRDLIIIGAQIATQPKYYHKLKQTLNQKNLTPLDKQLQTLESKKTSLQRRFVLPGANLCSSALDISRCVCRRAERRVVTAMGKSIVKNPQILKYLNRLSDVLYLLARKYGTS